MILPNSQHLHPISSSERPRRRLPSAAAGAAAPESRSPRFRPRAAGSLAHAAAAWENGDCWGQLLGGKPRKKYGWLVGQGQPSEKYEFVNWDDESNPILMGKFNKWQPNHQPVWDESILEEEKIELKKLDERNSWNWWKKTWNT